MAEKVSITLHITRTQAMFLTDMIEIGLGETPDSYRGYDNIVAAEAIVSRLLDAANDPTHTGGYIATDPDHWANKLTEYMSAVTGGDTGSLADCEIGLHSWTDDTTIRDHDYLCTRCGEPYGP